MADMHSRSPRLAVRHKVGLDAGRRFAMGDGGMVLLRAIDASGSIRAAAARTGWSNRHALAYLDNAERAIGTRLVERARGGNDRGGATLTPYARDFLDRYDRFRRRLDRALHELYGTAFHKLRA